MVQGLQFEGDAINDGLSGTLVIVRQRQADMRMCAFVPPPSGQWPPDGCSERSWYLADQSKDVRNQNRNHFLDVHDDVVPRFAATTWH